MLSTTVSRSNLEEEEEAQRLAVQLRMEDSQDGPRLDIQLDVRMGVLLRMERRMGGHTHECSRLENSHAGRSCECLQRGSRCSSVAWSLGKDQSRTHAVAELVSVG